MGATSSGMASGMASTAAAHGMAGGMTGVGSMPASAAASFGHMHPPFPHYAPDADEMVDPIPLAATASASASTSSIGSWSAQQHNDDVGPKQPIQGRRVKQEQQAQPVQSYQPPYQPNTRTLQSYRPMHNEALQQRKQRVESIAEHWRRREFPKNGGVRYNINLKIVGSTGSSYVEPIPDFERYQQELAAYDQQKVKRAVSPYKHQMEHPDVPQLHYKSGPIIRMNKWQREQQKRGQLPGCVANCHVPPIGSVEPKHRRGHMMGVEFPDADEVMQEYQ